MIDLVVNDPLIRVILAACRPIRDISILRANSDIKIEAMSRRAQRAIGRSNLDTHNLWSNLLAFCGHSQPGPGDEPGYIQSYFDRLKISLGCVCCDRFLS